MNGKIYYYINSKLYYYINNKLYYCLFHFILLFNLSFYPTCIIICFTQLFILYNNNKFFFTFVYEALC